jgi:hypothetical protein
MGGSWWTLRQVIDLFVAMGCEPQEFRGQDVVAGAKWQVRYLFNPATGTFVALRDLKPDSLISPSMLASWERALRIELPKPDNTH